VLAATAGQAYAAIPAGNLLLNGNGEAGAAATDATTQVCPQSWACGNKATVVRYGVSTFPSAAESARIGGGSAFFAGGPDSSADADVSQLVNVSAAAAEIDAGHVQTTFGGCAGGWRTLNDLATFEVYFFGATGTPIGGVNRVAGPTAAERSNLTQLLPRSKTVQVPNGARSIEFVLEASFNHDPSDSPYNNGYGDNLSLQLSPSPGPAPATATCQPASGGGGGGGGDTGGGGPPGTHGAGPHQKLSFKRTQDIDNVALFVRSDVDAKLTATGGVSVPAGLARTLGFKRIRKAVKANTRTKVRLRFSRKRKAVLKHALRHKRRLKARVKLTAVDGAGNRQVRRVKIAVKN
jgi:hypothetical protein